MFEKKANQKERENEEKAQKSQIGQFWTEHCRTLIAYEMKYVMNRKPKEQPPAQKPSTKKKKANLYESGFLIIDGHQARSEISVPSLITNHKYLSLIFEEPAPSPDLAQLKKLIKMMLELKNELIVKQFCSLYEIIVREIWEISIETVRKQDDREKLIEKISSQVVQDLQKNSNNYLYISKYMKECALETQKLFKVTIYCFLAEKLNFNLNQYFSEAFANEEEESIRKKPKLNQESL